MSIYNFVDYVLHKNVTLFTIYTSLTLLNYLHVLGSCLGVEEKILIHVYGVSNLVFK